MSNPQVNSTQENVRDENQKRPKADWNDQASEVFIRICVDETLAGNRPNGHFNKVGWKSIINKFAAMTGRNYTYKQFKNKWDSLKKDWQIWTNLTGKETGLGWDPIKQTIDASDEWCTKKLKLDILFKHVAATGDGAWAPSSGFVPINDGPTMEGLLHMDHVHDQEENFNININDSEWLDNINVDADAYANVTQTQDNGKKRKKMVVTKVGAAVKLSKQLDRMYDSMDKFVENKSEQNCSISEVMEILESMPEI
ncbi:hypothetical protein Dsin_008537 [Dipteronia sinensis]|uniref:Myb/SANT-like domain-containing protein n=1 Tax=Dipteronia sinensis TaxID=43782 RepID=A0AAE0EB96_9ROSI|nr:hypothetical protein Dsin_008537 [Dipteronia sinensis]